jgi:hypothetical protein
VIKSADIGWMVCVEVSVSSSSPSERKCSVVDCAVNNILLQDIVVYVCILYVCKWPHCWPKHVAFQRVYKLILVYLGAFVGGIIAYVFLLFVCMSVS